MATADIVVLALLLFSALGLAWTAKKSRDSEDFILASRVASPMLCAFGLVAVDLGALTLAALPESSARVGIILVPFIFGAWAGRLAGAFWLAGRVFRSEGLSVYSRLEESFGPRTRQGAAVVFGLSRLAASGVRVAAAVAALSALFGISEPLLAIGLGVFAWLIVFPSGLRGVLRVGVLGVLSTLACLLCGLAVCVHFSDGGWRALWEAGRVNGLLSPAPIFGAPFLRGIFRRPELAFSAFATSGIQALGTTIADFEFSQKLMAAPSEKDARRALLWASFGSALISLLAVLFGILLSGLYRLTPAFPMPEKGAMLVSFISALFPPGARGLFAFAIILSACALPLLSLSASALEDLGWAKATQNDLRWASAGAAVACLSWAWVCANVPVLAGISFEVAPIGFGALFGLFAAALWTEASGERCLWGLAFGLATALSLSAAVHAGAISLAWTWLGPIAAAVSFAFASSLG
jgi:Na+/proline symporter